MTHRPAIGSPRCVTGCDSPMSVCISGGFQAVQGLCSCTTSPKAAKRAALPILKYLPGLGTSLLMHHPVLSPVHAQSVSPAENRRKTDMRSHSLPSRLAYTLCTRSSNVGISLSPVAGRPTWIFSRGRCAGRPVRSKDTDFLRQATGATSQARDARA